MRLVHLTDPHLSSLAGQSFRSVSGKQRSGYLSWTRRRQFIHLRSVLDHLTEAVQQENADQLILSGDLVQVGLEEEFQQAQGWLAHLAPADRILFVPGNHDVYAKDSWAALRRHCGAVLPAPLPGTPDSPVAGYPLKKTIGAVRLIGASSACVTPVFSARGALGKPQLEKLSAQLTEARLHAQPACLAIHHPPLADMSPWRKALREVKALQNLITLQQPAIVLCGHMHHNVVRQVGQTRVYCTASASNTHNASYRVFDIEPGPGEHPIWRLRMQLKSITSDGKTFRLAEDQHWDVTL